MKGFASTLIFTAILSIFILLNGLDYKLNSSMLAQKESIAETQAFNERIYSMQDGFKKTVEEANKDVENHVLDLSGKLVKLSAGKEVDFLDETYVCYKIQEWADENNYSAEVVLPNPLDLSEEKPSKKIVYKGKQYNSINSKIKSQTKGLLSLENVLICTAFLNSKKQKGVVEVGLNDKLPINFEEIQDILSKPFAFSIKSKLAGEEVKALILGGEKL